MVRPVLLVVALLGLPCRLLDCLQCLLLHLLLVDRCAGFSLGSSSTLSRSCSPNTCITPWCYIRARPDDVTVRLADVLGAVRRLAGRRRDLNLVKHANTRPALDHVLNVRVRLDCVVVRDGADFEADLLTVGEDRLVPGGRLRARTHSFLVQVALTLQDWFKDSLSFGVHLCSIVLHATCADAWSCG